MKQIALMVVAALALLAVGAGAASAQTNTLTITMNAQNNSGQTGTATLTDMGNGQTRVVVNISGGLAEGQPAHIHTGTCANLNPVPKYPLNSIVNGMSDSTVPVSLATLTSGQFAVNVHKSKTEATVYVSCGDIMAQTVSAPTGGSTTGATPGMPKTGNGNQDVALIALAFLGAALTGSGYTLARRRA